MNSKKVLEEIVKCLTNPLVLAYPDCSQPFILHTDASKDGLGAILNQVQDGKMRVIGYASRTLSPAEKGYHLHSGKIEFLALKWSVCVTTLMTIFTTHPTSPSLQTTTSSPTF